MIKCKVIEADSTYDISERIEYFYDNYDIVDIKVSTHYRGGILDDRYVVMIIYKI